MPERLDNLSAATHELVLTGGRSLTKRFAEVVGHFGFEASRIQPGSRTRMASPSARTACSRPRSTTPPACAGAASPRRHLAPSTSSTRSSTARRNQARGGASAPPSAAREPTAGVHEGERARPEAEHYQPLRSDLLGPSRLIGRTVEARVDADEVEVRLGDEVIETMPRLRGENGHRIDYRHVMGSLV